MPSFSEEVAAMGVATAESYTEAICRIPKLRRRFSAEAKSMRERMNRLETASVRPGWRVSARAQRLFWWLLVSAVAEAFAAGFFLAARR